MDIIVIAFILKLIDNSFSTVKNIYLAKEKYFVSALANAIGTFFYYVAIVQLSKSNSMSGIVSLCVATFLGSYIPGKLFTKLDKDKLYTIEVTADSLDSGIKFADHIRDIGLPVKTTISYNTDIEKVLSTKIYCINKKEVTMTIKHMPDSFKRNITTSIKCLD